MGAERGPVNTKMEQRFDYLAVASLPRGFDERRFSPIGLLHRVIEELRALTPRLSLRQAIVFKPQACRVATTHWTKLQRDSNLPNTSTR